MTSTKFLRVYRRPYVNTVMKLNTIDKAIRSEQARTLPPCPGNLESKVLRRVRLARANPVKIRRTWKSGGFDWFEGLLPSMPSKSIALSALALVLFLSTSASVFVASRHAEAAASSHLASNSLDFEVFKQTHVLNFD